MSPEEEQKTGRNPGWTRDELILALDYYIRHPGETHAPNAPEIVALSSDISAAARLLGLTGSDTLRNPNGVSMKLLNFRAHDPAYLARGRRGLQRGNRLEAELWVEFSQDPQRLATLAGWHPRQGSNR